MERALVSEEKERQSKLIGRDKLESVLSHEAELHGGTSFKYEEHQVVNQT